MTLLLFLSTAVGPWIPHSALHVVLVALPINRVFARPAEKVLSTTKWLGIDTFLHGQ